MTLKKVPNLDQSSQRSSLTNPNHNPISSDQKCKSRVEQIKIQERRLKQDSREILKIR